MAMHRHRLTNAGFRKRGHRRHSPVQARSHSSIQAPSHTSAMELAFAPSLNVLRRAGALRTLWPSRSVSARPSIASRPLRPGRAYVRCVASDAPPVSAVSVGAPVRSADIRDAFLAFFESKNHRRLDSACLVPDDPTIMLTIAGMVPFKPIFLGTAPIPDPPRATTSQKCIRTNDIENVGVTKRHHTFFEMLGNFSFGDYFKKQAIMWAWELLTEVYKIPPERLAVSVFEDDSEALQIWRDVVGIPEARIQRMGAADNFWASGPTGPCGPCSEIYYDFTPTSLGPMDLEDDERFIELYNLVFMQFSRDSTGEMSPLANKNIDTGMGLERMAQVLQKVDNNYETDLIRPIMDCVAGLAGFSYEDAPEQSKTSLKVVGDHIRAVAHLVADGVSPSNIGRGYIVRRLIRRAVRHGRLLGIEGTFAAQVFPVVAELATEAGLLTVQERLTEITREVQREEERFLTTLERGESRLDEVLEKAKKAKARVITGPEAFELYDTFGFPLELTEEIAAERGFSVDRDAFEVCMKEQRERARAARDSGAFDVEAATVLAEAAARAGPTAFVGYDHITLDSAKIAAMVVDGEDGLANEASAGDRVRILLDQTPFYAEGGGQVGDTGLITTGTGMVRIEYTRKEAGAYAHIGEVVSGYVSFGDHVHAAVNAAARRRIKAHHTATHLLQAALKRVIPDGGIAQAGSAVDADRLRFDFNCPRAVSSDELAVVEQLVNQWVTDGQNTVVSHMTLDEAKEAGAVAMFGEKYDVTEVRVVDVPGVAMELCGGTHVSNTADIGLLKIIGESGPSSGVRRIEAVCGAAVLPYLSVRDIAVRQLSNALKARPEELPSRVSSLQEELRAKSKQLDVALAELAVAKAIGLAESAVEVENGLFVVAKIDGEISSDSLKVAAEKLGERLGESGVVVLASVSGDKISLVAVAGKSAQKSGLMAGKLIGAVAKVCGGGGGGRPNLAQAGGREPSKLHEALETARRIISETL